MSEQASRSQEEVPTLSALKAAAEAIPKKSRFQKTDVFAENFAFHDRQREEYHEARAEFWRLAYKWRCKPIGFGGIKAYEEGTAIIAEVEART